MSERRLSFVIPARNEEALVGETLEAVLASVARAAGVSRKSLWLPATPFEVVVADDRSDDATADIVGRFAGEFGVRLLPCIGGKCAAARNAGAAASSGRVLCFVDADTIVPENAVDRILQLHEEEGKCLVLYRLVSREPGIRAWLWWTFWGLARHLPLSRAKSMPAFMSCDRAHFERYGPFDESCAIAEEWPLTGAAYRNHRERFLYERTLTRAHVQPANGASAVRLSSNIPEVGLGGPLPMGAALARRSHSTPGRRSMRALAAVRNLAERACFVLCLALGRLLRSAKYSNDQDRPTSEGERPGAKAPLLLRASPDLAGWSAGRRSSTPACGSCRSVIGKSVSAASTGASTVARSESTQAGHWSCLASPERRWRLCWRIRGSRNRYGRPSIERAVVALAEFHRSGLTPRRRHGRERHGRCRGWSRSLVRLRDHS